MTLEPSPARRGLDWLLATHPHLELVEADWQRPTPWWVGENAPGGRGEWVDGADAGPWLLVTLGQRSAHGGDVFALYPFAIWKATGAVHGMRAGEVLDPELYVPAPAANA